MECEQAEGFEFGETRYEPSKSAASRIVMMRVLAGAMVKNKHIGRYHSRRRESYVDTVRWWCGSMGGIAW